MKSKIAQAIVGGLVATAIMTVVGLMAPYMGLPKMNPAEMLSGMMGVSLMVGYLIHFMIGIIFAGGYVYFFNRKVHIGNKVLKGLLFGLVAFVFAQLMMLIIGMMMPMPEMGDMLLMMAGSMVGHLVFGVVVALIVPVYAAVRSGRNIKTVHAY